MKILTQRGKCNLFSVITFAIITHFSIYAQSDIVRLEIDTGKVNQLKLSSNSGEYQIETTGGDPWLYSMPLNRDINKESGILSFEYFCPSGLDQFQIFFSPDFSERSSKIINKVGLSEGWVGYTVDLRDKIKKWGRSGDRLRLDFGNRKGVRIQIRNIVLRKMTEREKELAINADEKKRMEAGFDAHLREYLSSEFPSVITSVEVDGTTITVSGNSSPPGDLYLCEVAPWEDVTESVNFGFSIPVNRGIFKKSFPRYSIVSSLKYDRLLSKWVLAEKNSDGFILRSHAHYPDKIVAGFNLPAQLPRGRKGLGGFGSNRGHIEDLDELDITSATVNIWFTQFTFTTPAPGRIAHNYNGKMYYFGEKDIALLDSTFRTTARKGIITAAILLVGKAEQCPDPQVGRLLQHPDMDPAGIYSMPNMTNPESVDCYAAVLDFLAERYSRPDNRFGRINHWIIHNEVDAGWVWTNMGEKSDITYMDAYIKSMRICYAIARKYNPYSEVFISLTHYWAWTEHPQFHPSKDLLEILLSYTRAEGDFKWAVAQHPYPQSLYEPKTWLDQQVDFTFNTPLITFKNLEVLNAWIKLPETQYQGKTKRTLWLSENGTNSKSYSEQDLKEQAAGFAYAWKKMKELDGIDGFQWHNWIDNRGEGGLRIGLRRFPDDKDDPGGKKPVWYLYKAADTKSENKIFDPYKEIIGIKNWKDIMYRYEIR